jgi:FdhD protein
MKIGRLPPVAMNSSPTHAVPVVVWNKGRAGRRRADTVVVEEPLEIRVDTRSLAVTMRTPGHDAELAVGFLLSEGIIRSASDMADIRPYPRNDLGNVLDILLAPGVDWDEQRLVRPGVISSSCGLCGKTTLEAVQQRFGRVQPGPVVTSEVIDSLPGQLRAAQETFSLTGGIHAAGLFDEQGRLLLAREDIGRHNALDKVLGRALLDGMLPLSRHILLLSGRVSFEMMQKSLSAGVPIIAAVSAPSGLAVEFARKSRQTLIGFLRDERFNVYAGHGRMGGRRMASRPPRGPRSRSQGSTAKTTGN